MNAYYSLKQMKKFKLPVVVLGTFDGVHIGHRELIRTAVKRAAQLSGSCLVLTFDHIPREILKKNVYDVLLTSLAEKVRLIGALGVDAILVMKFNRQLARQAPGDFVRNVLVKGLGVKLLVVGENYRFGAGQAGGVEQLKALGRKFGFQVLIVPNRQVRGRKVSSTWIRELLQQGQIAAANKLLGRRFSVAGTVSKGRHFGTSIGFPTANLRLDRRMLLPSGVFAAMVTVAGRRYRAVVNIGLRPSIRETRKERLVEAFIFGFHKMIYKQALVIEMVRRIRAERFFADKKQLAAQIARDADRARQILRRA